MQIVVNTTKSAFAAELPRFRLEFASNSNSDLEFRVVLMPYGLVLLTMIKIVLSAAISFASATQ